jgi:hypothetical protein
MKLKEAIQLLKDHNVWRRYDGKIGEGPKMIEPEKLGIAIDKVVNKFENTSIYGVSKMFFCPASNRYYRSTEKKCKEQCDMCKSGE